MARYRGQKALFEVIGGSARNKSARPSAEPLRPEAPKVAKPGIKRVPLVQAQPKERVVIPEKEVISWKPKPLQCHDGRIEITLSTRTATLVFMTLIVGLLACFKVGQWYPGFETRPLIEKSNNVSPAKPGLTMVSSSRQMPVDPEVEIVPSEPSKQEIVPIQAVKSIGYDNAIVIQAFGELPDLVAVGKFFATRGIGTEVVGKGSTYFLITRERFPYNPEKANTGGRDLLEEIRLLGQAYKAPEGLESFAPNRFKGAYGRNIDDQYIGEVTDVN
jgi:hypothetical protein